ncbi:hypothetical protein V1264_006573 [Littorina saxatilis]
MWRDRIEEWYPGLLERTFFLPPVVMRQTRYEEEQLASGQSVLVAKPPVDKRGRGQGPVLSESDVREEDCQQKVLNCLQQLSVEEKEVMFILSQLKFGNYLGAPSYAAAASALPRPIDLKKDQKHQGDFDVLIIHKRCGIIVGEIKSVGADKTFFDKSQPEQDQLIKKKIEQSIKQLKKAEDVLLHIVSDMKKRPKVSKSLMMPNITRTQLQRVLTDDESLCQNLSDCLGLDGTTDPTPLCLTLDDLLDPERFGPPLNRPKLTAVQLRARWWEHLLGAAGADPNMTDDAYLELITRFGGPATTVNVFCPSVPRLAQAQADIRTPGEGVSETGNRFSPVDIVLHPRQVEIINDPNLKQVFLSGPPGTGKTLIMVMKGLEWIRQGKPVHIVSCYNTCLASSYMIASQLERSGGPGAQQLIHFHNLNMTYERNRVIEMLVEWARMQSSGGQELYVIMDEAVDVFYSAEPVYGFCRGLNERIPNLHLWAAALYPSRCPPTLQDVRLTEPLRSPPSVTDIVRLHRGFIGSVLPRYAETPSPLPSHGPLAVRVWHEGEDHSLDKDTYECEQCGRDIAKVLRDLNVGGTRRNVPGSPEPLTNSDVFILTWGTFFTVEKDSDGNPIQPTRGVLKGVVDGGFPVTVLDTDAEGIRLVATNTGPDHVIASNSTTVNGLERKIVVFVQHDGPEHEAEDWGKLWAMSRCTSQLVWLMRPRPPRKRYEDTYVPPPSREGNDNDSRKNAGGKQTERHKKAARASNKRSDESHENNGDKETKQKQRGACASNERIDESHENAGDKETKQKQIDACASNERIDDNHENTGDKQTEQLQIGAFASNERIDDSHNDDTGDKQAEQPRRDACASNDDIQKENSGDTLMEQHHCASDDRIDDFHEEVTDEKQIEQQKRCVSEDRIDDTIEEKIWLKETEQQQGVDSDTRIDDNYDENTGERQSKNHKHTTSTYKETSV